MSRTNPSICCSRCGRIIYEPLIPGELRKKKYARHIDYYAVNEDGREDELCTFCYLAWKGEVKDE
jgi:hypothetical protein